MHQNKIDEIRANADIVQVISGYIPLTLKGRNYFGVCPFHDDHSPSMSVSKEKQLYRCFSCGAGGNVFNFVKEYENVSFLEAVKIVASKVGLSFSYDSDKRKDAFEKEHKLMNLCMTYYQNNLNSKEALEARSYLNSRSIDKDIIKMFHLGFAFKGNNLTKALKSNTSMLESLGLTKEDGGDVFQNRIIFPIFNPLGDVVAFIGRTLLKDGIPKYLNSKETAIFRKGNVLYNYHNAKDYAKKNKKIIIVEGNMDAIRMSACGFLNTIALMGTALTSNHIDLLKKLRVPVVLLLDNDDAGKVNTYQNGLLLEKEGVNVRVVRLSLAKDPDEYLVKFGPLKMEEALKHDVSFLDFKLNYLKESYNLSDYKDLILYLKEVLKTIDGSDALESEVILKRLASDYDVSYDLLKSMVKPKENVFVPINDVSKKVRKSRYDLCASMILYYMMNDEKYIKKFQSKLGYFNEKKYRQIASEVLYYYEKHRMINLADFLSYVEVSPIKDDILELLKSIKKEDVSDNTMDEYLKNIRLIMIDEEITDLKKKQKESMDENEKNELASKVIDLKKEKEEIKKERSDF